MKGNLIPRLVQMENLLAAARSDLDLVLESWASRGLVPDQVEGTLRLVRSAAAMLQAAQFLIGKLERS